MSSQHHPAQQPDESLAAAMVRGILKQATSYFVHGLRTKGAQDIAFMLGQAFPSALLRRAEEIARDREKRGPWSPES